LSEASLLEMEALWCREEYTENDNNGLLLSHSHAAMQEQNPAHLQLFYGASTMESSTANVGDVKV
jgi:hypothetical protein